METAAADTQDILQHCRPSFIKYLHSVPVPFKNKSEAGRIEFPQVSIFILYCNIISNI